MDTARGSRGWRVWLALALPVVGGYLLLPNESVPSNIVYDAIGLVSALMIIVAVRRLRPARPALWWLMGIGQATWVIGDIIYSLYAQVLHEEPFPSVADVFYLASYPLILGGLALVVRSRRRASDIAGALDAGIVATGAGLLFWTFLIRPVLTDTDTALTTRLVAVGYPVADILILAMLVWLLTTGGARIASYGLLLAAVLGLLVSDIAFSVLTTWFAYSGGVVDLGWLLSYVLWAAAAWHPSMHRLGEPSRVAVASRRRQVVLGATTMVLPGLLLVQGLNNGAQVDWLGASTGGALLSLLLIARYADLLRQVNRQSARLAAMALRDDVTGLGNRHLLEQQLTDGLADPDRQVVLVVLDLADFHHVNDRYGRATGDALLAAVADRLRPLGPDGALSRIGGDEFALLLHVDPGPAATRTATPAPTARTAEPGITPTARTAEPQTSPAGFGATAVEATVAEVRRLLAEPFTAAGQTLLVNARIGMVDTGAAPGAPSTVTAAELLRRADVAVDAARRDGADTITRYHPGLDKQLDEQARIGAALRSGLDEGQFELRYQPIVDLADERLVAVEALIRWHHPTLGLVRPDGFIPVAERSGVIVELGHWVLCEACAQAVRWDAAYGPAAPRRVSVNVSPRQLSEPGFADSVAAVLAQTGLPADRLTIEVTETAVFGGGPALAALWAVHALGVRVALDDFGTGQSSLGLLRDCPVDILKVDKSFIAALTEGGRESAIVAGLIGIIDRLGLTAVAEGVEEPEQAAQLKRLGYHLAQGYLFGRPQPAADLQRLLGVQAGPRAEQPQRPQPATI